MKFSATRLAVQLAASLALSAGFATAAHADDYTVFTSPPTLTGTQLAYTFSQVIAAGDFTMTVWAEGATEYDQMFTALSGSGVSFSGLSVYIQSSDEAGNLLNTPVPLSSASVSASSISTTVHDQSASFVFYEITGTASAAGTITGTVLDDTNFTPVATPVPEPGTWALMLGGLGVVGASLSKRRRA